MNKTALIIILIGLAGGLFFMFSGPSISSDKYTKESEINDSSSLSINKGDSSNQNNVEVIDGVQYIKIEARGGYWPKVSNAQAGIPTKLLVKTEGTYDCSLALNVRSADFQKILEKTGEEVIDLGIPVSGTPTRGVCGMGMYSFVINYK